MFEYFEKIYEIIENVEKNEKKSIENAIKIITKAIENKNSIYIFGASHAGILSQELYFRAGGLVLINPIFARELMLDNSPITITSKMERLDGYGEIISSKVNFKKGDILILHSVSGRNPVIIDLGLNAKHKGVVLIGLTNKKYNEQVESRHKSGKKLIDIVDVCIDNHGDVGDACCSIEGVEQRIGASSTVIGALILNNIVVEISKELAKNKIENLPIFYSANLDGGEEKNRKVFEEYKNLIHYEL